jgi:hypothetical protein
VLVAVFVKVDSGLFVSGKQKEPVGRYENQHQAYRRFKVGEGTGRDVDLEQNHDNPYQEDGGGMAQPPKDTVFEGVKGVAALRDDGGNGQHMVGFDGMKKAFIQGIEQQDYQRELLHTAGVIE